MDYNILKLSTTRKKVQIPSEGFFYRKEKKKKKTKVTVTLIFDLWTPKSNKYILGYDEIPSKCSREHKNGKGVRPQGRWPWPLSTRM